jgi:pimeloyl-ACP methyl ester carboxylesterase
MWDTLAHRWFKIPYALYVSTYSKAKKPRATILFIHGIGNSGAAWEGVIAQLPDDLRLVTIDLLGFGESKRPAWLVYDAKTQARSVLATYLKLRLSGKVIVVGHSLGALVAIEIAKRYPLLVKALVLYGPPFYKVDATKKYLLASSDKLLRDLYRLVKNHPHETVKIAALALKLGLVNKTFRLTHETAPAYVNALEASIINQTSLSDALKITAPTQIIYGRFDPVVLLKNLRFIEKHNPRVHVTTILAAHEVQGTVATKAVVDAILEAVNNKRGVL